MLPAQEREKLAHCAYTSKSLPSWLCKKKTWEVAAVFYSMQSFHPYGELWWAPCGKTPLVLSPVQPSQRHWTSLQKDYELPKSFSLLLLILFSNIFLSKTGNRGFEKLKAQTPSLLLQWLCTLTESLKPQGLQFSISKLKIIVVPASEGCCEIQMRWFTPINS